MFRNKSKELNRSYKKTLIFHAEIYLREISLHVTRPNNLTFEFHNGNNIVISKNYTRIAKSAYSTKIKQKITVPFQIGFDIRKQRFFSKNLLVYVVNHHQTFNKKIGEGVIKLSQILN